MTTQPAVPPTEHDVALALPRQWITRRQPAPDIVVLSRARTVPASGFRPELVVQSQPVTGDLESWCDDTATALREQWDRLELEDDDVFDLNGHRVGYRRFAHVVGAVDVMCEQWSWLVEGHGITLTCSVAREDYLDYGDLFEQVADTVEITAPDAPGSALRDAARW